MKKNLSLQFKELSVELTHRCVMNCIFCSSSASKEPIIKEEIDYNRLKNIIKECKEKYSIKKISLSGGDPLLYSHFHDLLKFILQSELDCLIYTTGIIHDKNNLIEWPDSLINKLTSLKQEYPNDIQVIFDIQAPDKVNYEKITRVENSFSILVNTLNKLKDIKAIRKSCHFVPFKLNWNLIEETINFCLSYNFENIKILRFVEQGRASDFVKLELGIEEFYNLQRILKNLKEKYKEKLVLGHPIDFLFLIDPTYKVRPCRGGSDAPIILPNGNVYPCPAWKNIQDLCAGNIYKQNFQKIWESKYFEFFRNFILKDFEHIIGLCQECKFLNSCKGKCVAQRILKYHSTPKLPKCLDIGPDPLCLRLFKNS